MKTRGTSCLIVAATALLAIALAAPAISPAGTTDFKLSLGGKKKQQVKKLNVKVSCIDVACDALIKGRVRAFRSGASRGFKLERRRRSVELGAISKVGLRVKGRARRAQLARMLRNGGEAEATIRGEAETVDGSTDKAKKLVKLLP